MSPGSRAAPLLLRRQVGLGAGGLIAAALASSVLSAGCRRGPAAKPAVRLRIGVDVWAGYGPLFIAEARGLFRARELEVRPVVPQNTSALAADLASGALDAIAVALADVINVTQRNPDIRVVLVPDESTGSDMLVGREALTGEGALRGRRLGVNFGGFGELVWKALLDRYGVRLDEVQLVDLDAAEVPDALRSGLVDAGHTWDPFAHDAQRAGAHLWLTTRETPGLVPSCVAVQGRLVRRHPEAVRGFIDAWFEAAEHWQRDVREGARLVAQAFGVAPEACGLEGITLQDRAANRALFEDDGHPGSLPGVVRSYIDHFVARGMLSSPPSVARLLDPSFL